MELRLALQFPTLALYTPSLESCARNGPQVVLTVGIIGVKQR